MEEVANIIRSNIGMILMVVSIVIMIILYVLVIIKFHKIDKNYSNFMKKLGNGKDISKDLQRYQEQVEQVEKTQKEMIEYYQHLDQDIGKCIQKVGVVRYSAFRDTGSDLSFSLALLNEQNDGVVLNGIYSREMSNIYAKPIQKGSSSYTLSEEEQQALQIAMQQKRK